MDINTYAAQGAATAEGVSDALSLGAVAQTKKSGSLSVATQQSSASGDTVSISDAAKALAAGSTNGATNDSANGSAGDSTSGSAGEDSGVSMATVSPMAASSKEESSKSESTVEKIEKQIKELQQQIQEAQQDPTLGEKERQQKVQMLQSQLMLLQSQLAKAQSGDASSTGTGGTRAEGMAQSLTGA